MCLGFIFSLSWYKWLRWESALYPDPKHRCSVLGSTCPTPEERDFEPFQQQDCCEPPWEALFGLEKCGVYKEQLYQMTGLLGGGDLLAPGTARMGPASTRRQKQVRLHRPLGLAQGRPFGEAGWPWGGAGWISAAWPGQGLRDACVRGPSCQRANSRASAPAVLRISKGAPRWAVASASLTVPPSGEAP